MCEMLDFLRERSLQKLQEPSARMVSHGKHEDCKPPEEESQDPEEVAGMFSRHAVPLKSRVGGRV